MPPPLASRQLTATVPDSKIAAVPVLLKSLLDQTLILSEDWEALSPAVRKELSTHTEVEVVLERLVEERLLTRYQVSRIRAGTTYGLVLGSYRVLDRLGAGGMAVVFTAEHALLRRVVAVKVLSLPLEEKPRSLKRFFTEMRAGAELRHPNIVGALDAGIVQPPNRDLPILHYFVMEYVPGQDLETLVDKHGPLPVGKACELIYQVACALAEAHKHNLIHRDIKPSNILITPEGQAKLLDFGLARYLHSRVTEPGTMLGTIDYMAPEQTIDAGSVDIRADIYGLGGTLYWCLAGQPPFPPQGSVTEELIRRRNQSPPKVRRLQSAIPADLDEVLTRMMANKPEERFATPQDVLRALRPFVHCEQVLGFSGLLSAQLFAEGREPPRPQRILLVDDDANNRFLCRCALQSADVQCEEASSGLQALETLRAKPFDLVLLDHAMPGMTGADVLRRLRETPPWPHLKIVMCSGQATPDEMAHLMLAGADDYLSKPFSLVQLKARVLSALRLKLAQDHADVLNQKLVQVNVALGSKTDELIPAYDALVLALANLAERRYGGKSSHLRRLKHYCRLLAESAGKLPAFADVIDADFVHKLESSVHLHDIGQIALPDQILLKPGKLESDERMLVESHTLIGAEILKEVIHQHGSLDFLPMALDIIQHHHERYDGKGYPDQMKGSAIPLAARLVAIADTYDALRSKRSHRPGQSHLATVRLITENSPGQFDPLLLQAFKSCAAQFDNIYQDLPD